ncbi:sperm-associated antigen 5 [Leptodactylus fuscus]|uniref:sperm-associated antigen 5 n=1 Tax=Leptodactylus fuscus TaxID=238119 RepID=UPI003F4E9AAC
MWSPANPASDENQVPAVQNVHRKSVGRTPFKVVTGQQLAALDPNILVNKRPSLSKTSSRSSLTSKESTRVSVGTQVNIWIDHCYSGNLTKSSVTETNTSLTLPPPSSLLESLLSEDDSLNLPAGPEDCDPFSQSCDIAVLSQSTDSLESHGAMGDLSEGYHSQSVNDVAHGLHGEQLLTLPSTNTINEIGATWEAETCQKTRLMPNEPESLEDAHGVLLPGSPLTDIPEPDEITSKDEDSIVEDVIHLSAYHMSKPAVVLPSEKNKSRLEELYGVAPNPATPANDTYEIDPHHTAASFTDVLSEVAEIIENWNLSRKDDDGSQTEPTDDEDKVECCLPVETSSSLPGIVVDNLRETQLLSGLQESLDPVVDDYYEKSLYVLPLEDSLVTEVIFLDSEASSYRTMNYPPETSANHCCTPIDPIMTEGSTTLTNTKWFSPIPNMDPIPNPDQGKVPENTPFTESCPTPMIPNPSKLHDLQLISKEIFKHLTPKMFSSPHEVGTSMTPVSTTEEVTWTTPIMLLNKSMNTSCDFIGKREKSAKDNSSETDSALWTFSREALSSASREELMDRLEGTLIVVEVLSRQLQGWQQKNISSKPSEQRECATQTCVTSISTEEQYYHNLYMRTLNRLQSVQQSQEQEETLQQHLKEATEALTSHQNEASSMIEFAKSLYDVTQKDRSDLQQKMSHTRKLFADHMSILEKMSEKVKDGFLQRDEMKAKMEKALEAKAAAVQCLQDLEIHSSGVITQLSRDLGAERQLCESVKGAYEQQRSYNEELADFVHRAQYICSEVEEDRAQLQRQCSQARELMSRHWRLFEIMKEKTQSALEEYEGLKMERDMTLLKNEEVHGHLQSVMSDTEQMTLENSRLGSELELLMGRLCTLESEIEQLNEDNSELEELLSAKESSMKLLEKELNEATARGLEYQDRIKHLAGQVVPSLEMDLSNALDQKQTLQKQLEKLAKEHTSQIAYYTESLEFLEQENSVCREQVTETESQLKTHHLTVLERNFQCENLKDTIKELQTEVSILQEKLSHAEEEAQSRITKLSQEISDSSTEISKIKSDMLEVIETLRQSTKTEAPESLPGSQTPGRSLVPSKDEELTTTSINVTGTPHLLDEVLELSSTVADVVTTSSNALEEKQQVIQDLNIQIASLKEELQRQRSQHTSETRVLQEELANLKRKNCVLDVKINSKEKCISELQEVVNEQEKKILQQFSEAKESEALIQKNAELEMSLKVCEKEVEVLKQELSQNSTEAARSWIQEKLLLHKDLTAARLKLVDNEYSKSEAIQRLLRHKDILKDNLALSEAEVRKLDHIIVRIRQVLLSIPEVVNGCDKLRQLMEFLN